MMLDDTTHLLQEHDAEMSQIRKEWVEKFGVTDCSISECKKVMNLRRGRNREKDINAKTNDALYDFYTSIYHRVHNFIFHFNNVGVRLELQRSQADSEIFIAKRDAVRPLRKRRQVALDRFDETNNNKFTIQMMKSGDDALTLKDALFQTLASEQIIHENTLRQMNLFLLDNGFDSDAVEMDLRNKTSSNLMGIHQSQTVNMTMSKFITSINCM